MSPSYRIPKNIANIINTLPPKAQLEINKMFKDIANNRIEARKKYGASKVNRQGIYSFSLIYEESTFLVDIMFDGNYFYPISISFSEY